MAKTRNPNGMGNIYKRDDNRYEWKQMIDGSVRYESDMDLSELRRKIKRLTNIGINKNKTKLFEWIENWLEVYVKLYKKPSTYNNYKYAYEKYIKKYMKNIQLRHVSKADVQKMITDLINAGYSPSLIKNVRKALSVAFISANEDEQLVDFNPTRDTKLPKGKTPSRKTFQIEELAAIIKKFSSSRWLYAILFMLATGLRRGELLAVKWSNVDFKDKCIKIEQNQTIYGIDTPKDNEYHYVPLTDHAVSYLSGWKNQLQKEHNPAIYKAVDTIFVSIEGKPLQPLSFNHLLTKRNFGFKVTPHMFRHTFVYLSKGKISLSELQEALGHDQSTTTLDIYGLMITDTVTVADKIEIAYKELDETMKEKEKKNQESNVIDFTKRRLAKQ
ncbi:MAG: tyrosine-type recombinase/integrase [Lutibacter sp.]|jgi:integrase